MLQAWRAAGIITFCGYILGFPEDTAASIEHDIEILKRELPVDCLEFFVLTPLPGSEDHQKLARSGVAMERDMNKYDLEHVCTAHGRMTSEEWQGVYQRAWLQYYGMEHIETLLRRAVADGIAAKRLMLSLVVFRGMPLIEQCIRCRADICAARSGARVAPDRRPTKALLFYRPILDGHAGEARTIRRAGLAGEPDSPPRSARTCGQGLYRRGDREAAARSEEWLEMMQDRPRLAVAEVG